MGSPRLHALVGAVVSPAGDWVVARPTALVMIALTEKSTRTDGAGSAGPVSQVSATPQRNARQRPTATLAHDATVQLMPIYEYTP